MRTVLVIPVVIVAAVLATSKEFTNKKGGKVVRTGTHVVSKDGKVMTATSKGTDAQGQPTSMVLVYDKQ
jgi:hypothetical protein